MVEKGHLVIGDTTCADPESFVREGPTLTLFFFFIVVFLVYGMERGSKCH